MIESVRQESSDRDQRTEHQICTTAGSASDRSMYSHQAHDINRSLAKSSAILCKCLNFSPFISFNPIDPEFLSFSTLPFHL
jgi:hypothetical protein